MRLGRYDRKEKKDRDVCDKGGDATERDERHVSRGKEESGKRETSTAEKYVWEGEGQDGG